MDNARDIDVAAVMADDHVIEQAANRAVRRALIDHKRTGDPVAIWEDGKVVWIPASRINDDGTVAPAEPGSA